MLLQGFSDHDKKSFLESVGLNDDFRDPTWPLPNLKASDEAGFWRYRATYGFRGEAWCGRVQIDGRSATLLVYFAGTNHLTDGGFAVAYVDVQPVAEVRYYEWRACDHDFADEQTGRCLHRYTCRHCNKSFEVDSSG